MKNCDSHFYLYAKGWYERGDTRADLKKIIAHRCMLLEEHVTDKGIIELLAAITFPYIVKGGAHNFHSIMVDLVPGADILDMCQDSEQEDIALRMMKRLIRVLMPVQITEGDTVLLELDEPDYNILPKRNQE